MITEAWKLPHICYFLLFFPWGQDYRDAQESKGNLKARTKEKICKGERRHSLSRVEKTNQDSWFKLHQRKNIHDHSQGWGKAARFSKGRKLAVSPAAEDSQHTSNPTPVPLKPTLRSSTHLENPPFVEQIFIG